MSVWSDFQKFALRGNIIDLAVGFTVGAAFSTIAKSLVSDVLMPPIGLLLGRADFSDLFILLREGAKVQAPYATLKDAQAAGAVTINYGMFVNNVLAFLIVALSMFAIIRLMTRVEATLEDAFGAEKPPEEPPNKMCPFCRSVIPFRAIRCPACTSNLEANAA